MSQFAPTSNSSRLSRRDFWDDIGDALDDAADAISNVGSAIEDAGNAIVSAGEEAGSIIGSITGSIIDSITDAISGEHSKSMTIDIDIYAQYLNDPDNDENDDGDSNENDNGEDGDDEEEEEAPWDNAYLLFSWGKDASAEGENSGDGESTEGNDNSGDEGDNGDAADKRGLQLLEQREVSKALNLYCVDCGLGGSVTATGSIGLSLVDGITDCSVSIEGNMKAGLYLGLQAYVAYENSYTKELIKHSLTGWEIPNIIVFGPYASLGVEASVEAKAEGTVLVGAEADWPDFQATLDLLDPSQSSTSGWTPDVTKKFEAKGEISLEASLGLPVAIGVGLDLLDGLWSVGVELRDTPAIVAEGDFSISYSANQTTSADGTSTSGSDLDVNDGCYGIAWNIHLQNTLSLDVTGLDEYPLLEWEGDPLAEGCIGYQDDSDDGEGTSTSTDPGTTTTNPPDSGPTDTGSTTTTTDPADPSSTDTSTTTTTTAPSGSSPTDSVSITTTSSATGSTDTGSPTSTPTETASCTPTAQAVSPAGQYCGLAEGRAISNSHLLNLRHKVADEYECATKCLNTRLCHSFGYKRAGSTCQMYRSRVEQVKFHRGSSQQVYDKSCFALSSSRSSRFCSTETDPRRRSTIHRSSNIDIFSRAHSAVTPASITDASGEFKLVPAADGNVELGLANDTSVATTFVSMSHYVIGDSSSRLLLYYPGSVAATGASRLRLGAWGALPKSSAFVTLVPVTVGSTQALVAVDTLGNTLYPVVCEIDSLGNKVFLVDDPSKASAELMAQAVRSSITGGTVEQCAPLVVTAS